MSILPRFPHLCWLPAFNLKSCNDEFDAPLISCQQALLLDMRNFYIVIKSIISELWFGTTTPTRRSPKNHPNFSHTENLRRHRPRPPSTPPAAGTPAPGFRRQTCDTDLPRLARSSRTRAIRAGAALRALTSLHALPRTTAGGRLRRDNPAQHRRRAG